MWKYEDVRREMVVELKSAYYDLFLAQKLTDVVENSRKLLRQFAEISESQYKVGKGAQQDVIKADVEVSRLLDRLTELERDSGSAQARINTLLYWPPDTPIVVPSDISIPKLPLKLNELYKKAEANNPQVRMNQNEIEKNEYNVAWRKRDSIRISRGNFRISTGGTRRKCISSHR